MKKNCCKQNIKGFTLIELLVVVLIIGILAAIALPQYQKAVRRARLTEAKVILKNLTKAQDMYYLRGGSTDDFSWSEVLDSKYPESTANWEFEVDECAPDVGNLWGCRNVAYPTWESGYSIGYDSVNYRTDDFMKEHFLCFFDDEQGAKKCRDFGGIATEYDDLYIIP